MPHIDAFTYDAIFIFILIGGLSMLMKMGLIR